MFAPRIQKPQPKAVVKAAAPSRAPVRPARPLNGWDANARSPHQIASLMRSVIQRKCASGAGASGGTCASCEDKESGRLQRKLTVGSSNDPLEHEADRVAEQVLAGPSRSDFSRVPVSIQRRARGAAPGARQAPASVDRVLASSGRTLDAPVRRDMETRFGHDFSQVRVHDGAAAAQSARDVSARAYTVGHDVVFGAGEYAPTSQVGRRLIAHELTHVVQQESSPRAFRLQREAKFVEGPVSETTDMVANFIAGNAKFVGSTRPTLNGKEILSADDAKEAIKAPDLGSRTNKDGTASAWVQSVPLNKASFTMQLPSAGPWSADMLKSEAVSALAQYGGIAPKQCSSDGKTSFSVKGQPNDPAFAANVKTHEQIHAANHKAGFASVIGVWDAKLETAKAEAISFNGVSKVAAKYALHMAMGDLPRMIAWKQHEAWAKAGATLHEGKKPMAQGGKASYSKIRAEPDCSKLSVNVT